VATTAVQPRLEWTGDPDADRLISESPTAMLIGFCLDQQVPIEWAFLGPLRMQERLGTFDATDIAAMDPAKVEAAFVKPPALHRFPASMARRVYGLCQIIADEYGGDPRGSGPRQRMPRSCRSDSRRSQASAPPKHA
jgi:uncharacterized HhH-GPD family protein